MSGIYLDANAASPLDPRVRERMIRAFDAFGNPASRDHRFGWDARDLVEEARAEVAALIGAQPREILFTGGATESIRIAFERLLPRGRGLLMTAVEHDAVRSAARRCGDPAPVEAPVDAEGCLDLDGLERALSRHRPAVLAVMAANNETGVLFPWAACASLARARGALFFTDATQAVGRVPFDVAASGADFAAFAVHKMHGPKGVGVLYVRGGPEALPGGTAGEGGAEAGLGGTLNVPAIVGCGEACRLAAAAPPGETSRLRELRDRFEASILGRLPEVRVNGHREARLPNTSNLLFPGVDARILLRAMHEVAASTRSACSSGSAGPSHVLKAMGLSDEEAFASVRFSLGRFTSAEEIGRAADLACTAYKGLKAGT
jgi:cysteine desulfurase